MPVYSEAFKAKMLKKMLPPDAVSANTLSGRVGVHQSTLSRWLREAQDGNGMARSRNSRKRQWTTLEKLRVVVEASGLPDAELGEFLRREGVHEAQLREWREAAHEALAPGRKGKSKVSAEHKKIRRCRLTGSVAT